MRRLAFATTIVAVTLAGTVTAASAAPIPNDCKFVDALTFDCSVDVVTPGSTDTAPAQSASTGTPTAVWVQDVLPKHGGTNLGLWRICQTGNGSTVEDGGIGVYYQYALRDTRTGATLATQLVCVPINPDNTLAAPVPPPPPQPPTREEINKAAPVPLPVISANPAGRGLTGIESRFWVDNPGTVNVSVELRGWNVAGTLTADAWNWATGDDSSYLAYSPGSAEDPAVRHVYQNDSNWPVSVTASWTGSYTVSGYGTSFTVDGLATAGSSSIDYAVIEVRGVLDQPQHQP